MKTIKKTAPRCSLSFLVVALVAASASGQAAELEYSPRVNSDLPLNVYFGDTHLHTSYSADASLAGNARLGPDEAYRFARGEEVKVHNGMKAKLNRPLDFLVVADHAEFLGLLPKLRASDPELLKNPTGKRWHDMLKAGGKQAYAAAIELINAMGARDEKIKSPAIKRSAWQDITDAAERYNNPGVFTAMIGYEWSSMPGGGNNLHRVLVYRDGADKAGKLLPFSAFDSENPEDLWRYMDGYEQTTGGRVLAMAHNGNVSNGLMFSDKDFSGKPLTPAMAKMRARWEPLYEVTQMKGDGETHPLLSPDDEFADYETWDKGNLLGTAKKEPWMLQHEYARSALKLGLKLEDQLGVNPFKFGLIGSTDAHTGLATAAEDNNWGKISLLEPSATRAQGKAIKSKVDPSLTTWAKDLTASGYAAVWAKENSREALFDAMQRRETYATTGSRMQVRFFGGWDYQAEDLNRPRFVDIGYRKGVPMGGDLTQAPAGKSPGFILVASKDPEGANLDRIQIVKGWLDEQGQMQEMVYNVAASDDRPVVDNRFGPVGSSVDIDNASYSNRIGDAQLATLWIDPDFDPNLRAFYYARVIEIPTPRWPAYDALRFQQKMADDVEMTTQERAYTSPIWYTP